MKTTIYGTRGSMPIAGAAFDMFGGQTSCYKIDIGDLQIYLDAGSGIVPASYQKTKTTYILLSHLHMDHILGLPQFKGLSDRDGEIHIVGNCLDGNYSGIREAVNTAFSSPFWPLAVDDYPATIHWQDIEPNDGMDLGGGVTFSTMASNHPGGSLIYRIDSPEGSIVYATDYESEAGFDERLIEFSRDCDMLIFDGQYTLEEAVKCKGYGHSTKEEGLEILRACGGKMILYSHYNPSHDDEFLAKEEVRLKAMDHRVRFARVGEVIELTRE